jgi:hypothetical protein
VRLHKGDKPIPAGTGLVGSQLLLYDFCYGEIGESALLLIECQRNNIML